MPTETDKQRALEAIRALPDTATMDQAIERLCFIAQIEEGLQQSRDGKVVSHDGAWLSGVAGARFGLTMPGQALLGARYQHEVAPKVAMDRAEIISVSETLETKAGKFERCLKTEETTPLESGKGYKVYAPGVGVIEDAEVKLVKFGMLKP